MTSTPVELLREALPWIEAAENDARIEAQEAAIPSRRDRAARETFAAQSLAERIRRALATPATEPAEGEEEDAEAKEQFPISCIWRTGCRDFARCLAEDRCCGNDKDTDHA